MHGRRREEVLDSEFSVRQFPSSRQETEDVIEGSSSAAGYDKLGVLHKAAVRSPLNSI